MNFRVKPLLVCTCGLFALAQEGAPHPAAPPVAPPVAPPPAAAAPPTPQAAPVEPKADGELAALKAELAELQRRLRQLGEDDVLRGAELRKAQEELAKKLPPLEALPERFRLAAEEAKAAGAQRTAHGQERLEGEKKALVAVLGHLEATQKELHGLGPLLALDKALGQYQEASAFTSQPAFNALVATVKDKLSKGPLGNPLKDASTMNGYFANPALGSAWTLAAVMVGPGWESDKVKNLDKGLAAVDAATRLEVEVKAAGMVVSGLKAEAALLQTSVQETLGRAQGLLDPAASAPALEGEALAAKVEAAFKPLLEAVAQSGLTAAERERLVSFITVRNEAQARMLEHRFLLARMLGVTRGLGDTLAKDRVPGRDAPTLEALLKSVEEARGRLKDILAGPGLAAQELAQLEAAGYPAAH